MMLPPFNPKDRELANWTGAVARALAASDKRIAFVWNSDAAPVSVRSGLSVMPSSVRVLDAVTELGAHVGGAAISWTWDNGAIVISAIGTLTASTDYTVTIGVVS